MKAFVTGFYALVITLALVVGLGLLGGIADIAARVFLCGFLIQQAAVHIGEVWRKGG